MEWQGSMKETRNPRIMELEVDVFHQGKDASLVSLKSYYYAE
jgi:hypothetical protein